jgi:hypothetical protein
MIAIVPVLQASDLTNAGKNDKVVVPFNALYREWAVGVLELNH